MSELKKVRGSMCEGDNMGKRIGDSRGFTLIAALLLTLLLSALAVGVLYMVSNEQRMGGNDLESNVAYYGAESGIENMTAQLSQLYQQSQTPNATAICALTAAANYPTNVSGSNITNMNYNESIGWPPNVTCPTTTNPVGTWDIVGSGSDQGMVASLIQFNLQVTATRISSAGEATNNAAITPTGASVNLTRTVEVALLPAFEFGVFCDGDCDYFAGPPFNFGGRVHTNGNLFLSANGGPLTFTDKISAVGQVVISQLENGTAAGPSAGSYNGSIYIPNASNGCPAAPAAGPGSSGHCLALSAGSWTGSGGNSYPSGSTPTNTGWTGISETTFKGFIENGATGATKLQLPFVNSSKVGAIDIIRKPTPGDSQQLSSSRLYNEASLRILLADTEGDLYPGETRPDSATQDIMIGTPFTNSPNGAFVTVSAAPGVNSAGNMYFATAQQQNPGVNNWTTLAPTGCSTSLASWPLFGQITVSGKQCQGAWLRVEYCPTTAGNCGTSPGSWVGITREWLAFGFARNYNQPPTHPYNSSTATAPLCGNYPSYPTAQCQNGISPAILILQQLQQTIAISGAMGGSATQYNWLPLNFYDAREGEPRDARPSGDNGLNCSPVGIMNTVELDTGNLWLWLQGSGPYSGGSGKLVNASTFNGYILYFADHRGMLQDLYPLTTFYNGFSGMSGLNDVVNSGSSVGVPDNHLEAITYYATAPTPYSPEDTAVKGAGVNGGQVDRWGETNLGAGFGITSGNMALPYYIYGSVTSNAVQCLGYKSGTFTPYKSASSPYTGIASAEWNMVTGPRHALRLVDAGMDGAGNSFVPPTNGSPAANGNGFTVTSEEPVYVLGNYNTGASDPFWPSENTLTTPHSAASIIADAVTLLSNPPAGNTTQNLSSAPNIGYSDYETFASPANINNRAANDSYYRMAIIAGKSIPFPNPSWSTEADFGTDGGMHNFLRYLENRGANSAVVNYAGSMISMYYSQYATGNFKCCTSVYGAPGKRNYFFDTLFQNPADLPPGTPMFQDVVSLGFHQNFTPQ